MKGKIVIGVGSVVVLVSILLYVPGCSGTPGPADVDIDVGNPVSASEEAELSEAKRRQPPLPWHQERVENIEKEDLEDTIANLANFDDMHFATTASGRGLDRGMPNDDMAFIFHLFRVRKLLQVGRSAPEDVIPVVRDTLQRALTEWPEAYKARQKKCEENPDGFSLTAPDRYEITYTQAMAATYLLAELQDYDSLPLLRESYDLHAQWAEEIPYGTGTQIPVSPPIILYAMHRLVSGYPAGRLSVEARNRREAYLEWASVNLPAPKMMMVSAPSADYDESDPRVRIMDPKGVVLRDQPKMEMAFYPSRFSDGEAMLKTTGGPITEARSIKWFELIDSFVDAAYPEGLRQPR